MMHLFFQSFFLAAFSCLWALCADAHPTKVNVIEQMLQREHIHHVLIDEPRSQVYFENVRARDNTEASIHTSGFQSADAVLKRLMVASLEEGEAAMPLFEQEADSGYFFASSDPWSPNRRYIAIYKYQEGRTKPGVFDFQCQCAKFFEVPGRFEHLVSSHAWISDNEFVFISDPDYSRGNRMVNSARGLAAYREVGWRDGKVAVEVFGSGVYDTGTSQERPDDVVVINADTNDVRPLTKGASIFAPKSLSGKVVVSQDILIDDDTPTEQNPNSTRILSLVDPFDSELKQFNIDSSMAFAWSKSGKFLLVERASKIESTSEGAPRIQIFDVASQSFVFTAPEGSTNFAWIGEQLVYTLDGHQVLVDPNSYQDKISVKSPTPIATSDFGFFYLENGQLWRVGLDGARHNLSHDFEHEIKLYQRTQRFRFLPIRPSYGVMPIPKLEDTQFVTEIEGHRQILIFSDDGDSFIKIPYPNGDYTYLLAASQKGAVFLVNTYGVGSELVYAAPSESERSRVLYSFNSQLSSGYPARGPIHINHYDYEGEDASAWLFLPSSASIDTPKPLPLIVIAYPSYIYKDPPINAIPFADNTWDLLLGTNSIMEVYAALGYAVLLPSIPIRKDDGPGDHIAQMMPAILSALDGAIETGFVDSSRTALTGQSFGGYAALSVATQTDRFQAIIATMPISNLTSHYGQFLPGAYADNSPDGTNYYFANRAKQTEGRMIHMQAPPWNSVDRYVHNSPLFALHEVRTPLLLIHSDLDSAAQMQQSEEFFSGLFRENKDALYVRYLGENHLLTQPQHQRDSWERAIEFLKNHGVAPNR